MNLYIKLVIVNLVYYTIPNKLFLRLLYFIRLKKYLNLKNPKKFTEIIQYLKLVQTDSSFTLLADKYRVREYVKEKIGDEVLTKLYWVGEKPENIPFEKLPNSFVIKCNHGSGYVKLVKNKNDLNIEDTKKEINKWLKDDFYKKGRELQYKNIGRKVLIEELFIDKITDIPMDYKIFCFNGEPDFIQLDIGRYVEHKRNLYDINWNLLDFSIRYNSCGLKIPKPKNLGKMIDYARILSEGFKFVRIDLYEVNGKIYFGEVTFTPGNGLELFKPNHEELDIIIGNKIKL